MPPPASIARNMLRVCSVNRMAREAAVSAAEAILREMGREMMVMVIESKSNVLLFIEIF
jgi:hypothetical protein